MINTYIYISEISIERTDSQLRSLAELLHRVKLVIGMYHYYYIE